MAALPELDEIVAAIREHVTAGGAMDVANRVPGDGRAFVAAKARWALSFEALRKLLTEIDAGLAEEFGSAP